MQYWLVTHVVGIMLLVRQHIFLVSFRNNSRQAVAGRQARVAVDCSVGFLASCFCLPCLEAGSGRCDKTRPFVIVKAVLSLGLLLGPLMSTPLVNTGQPTLY